MNTPLDTTTFENWMRQIMERFDRNEQLIASLTSKELREVKYLDGEQLLDNQDLCELPTRANAPSSVTAVRGH